MLVINRIGSSLSYLIIMEKCIGRNSRLIRRLSMFFFFRNFLRLIEKEAKSVFEYLYEARLIPRRQLALTSEQFFSQMLYILMTNFSLRGSSECYGF